MIPEVPPIPAFVPREIVDDDHSDSDTEMPMLIDSDTETESYSDSDSSDSSAYDSYVEEVLARRDDQYDEKLCDSFAVGLVDSSVLRADRGLSGKDITADGKGKLFCGHTKTVR